MSLDVYLCHYWHESIVICAQVGAMHDDDQFVARITGTDDQAGLDDVTNCAAQHGQAISRGERRLLARARCALW